MWLQREVNDGTYTFLDLLIVHELLDVKEANEAALQEWVNKNGRH
jgi:hypothetical protein